MAAYCRTSNQLRALLLHIELRIDHVRITPIVPSLKVVKKIGEVISLLTIRQLGLKMEMGRHRLPGRLGLLFDQPAILVALEHLDIFGTLPGQHELLLLHSSPRQFLPPILILQLLNPVSVPQGVEGVLGRS